MPQVVLKFSFIDFSVSICKSAKSFFLIFQEWALIGVAQIPFVQYDQFSLARHHIVNPLSSVFAPVFSCPNLCTLTALLAFAVGSLIRGLIERIVFLTSSVLSIIFPKSLVLDFFLGVVENTFAVHLASIKWPGILEAVGEGQGTITFAESVPPLAFIMWAVLEVLLALTMAQEREFQIILLEHLARIYAPIFLLKVLDMLEQFFVQLLNIRRLEIVHVKLF